jgi:GT2 family glycosyltransferase
VVKYSALPGVEVVVADNGSTDDSISLLENKFPEVKLIRFRENYGFAGGYNRALKQLDSEYYVILNSDVEVTPSWLEPVIDLLDSDREIVACMPTIKDYNHKDHFEYAGASGGFIDKYGFVFCRGRLFNVLEPDAGQYKDTREVFWATGACLFIRSNVFHQAGGFDERFFAHMEEIDLCWRLKNRGFKIFHTGKSEVYHVGGGALPMDHPRKTYLNFRNNLFLLYKNLPDNKFWKIMISRFFLDGIATIKFLASFEFNNFFSVFRAHLSFYSSIRRFRPDRLSNLGAGIRSDHPEIYPRSIVFDFFFRKKKRFSDLDWNG